MNPIHSVMAVCMPGDEINPERVAVHFVLQKGWHIYWENPGDTGMSTTLEGVEETFYPTPQSIPLPNNLTSYGYEGEVVLFGTKPTSTIEVRWLACTQDTCIPGKQSLFLQEIDSTEYMELWKKIPQKCTYAVHTSLNDSEIHIPQAQKGWVVPFSESVLDIRRLEIKEDTVRISWESLTSTKRLLWVQQEESCILSVHPQNPHLEQP